MRTGLAETTLPASTMMVQEHCISRCFSLPLATYKCCMQSSDPQNVLILEFTAGFHLPVSLFFVFHMCMFSKLLLFMEPTWFHFQIGACWVKILQSYSCCNLTWWITESKHTQKVKKNFFQSDKTRQDANFWGNLLSQSYIQYKNKSLISCQLDSCRKKRAVSSVSCSLPTARIKLAKDKWFVCFYILVCSTSCNIGGIEPLTVSNHVQKMMLEGMNAYWLLFVRYKHIQHFCLEGVWQRILCSLTCCHQTFSSQNHSWKDVQWIDFYCSEQSW